MSAPSETVIPMRWARFTYSGVAAILLAVWLSPVLPLPKPQLQENRVPAPWPKMPRTPAGAMRAKDAIDAYAADHFPIRTLAIASLNYVRYRLGYSGLTKVIAGPHGWLFYDNGLTVKYHLGLAPLADADIREILHDLGAYADHLQKAGVQFYLLAAPWKSSVYPNEMPAWAVQGQLDAERMAKAAPPDSRFIYPLQEIKAQKEPTYGPFDTHWNMYGAHAAYVAVNNRMRADLPAIGAPVPLEDFEAVTTPAPAVPRDMALMLGIAGWVTIKHPSTVTLPDHDPRRVEYLTSATHWAAPRILTTDAQNGLTLLLLRDSFATELLPLLKRNFSRIIVAHIQDGFFRDDLIEKYHPDAVLLETQETAIRYAKGVVPKPPQ